MSRFFFVIGAALALMAVLGGAIGAHMLDGRLPPERVASFELATQYQMFHALGLLAVGWAATRWPHAAVTAGGWLLLAGILLFSGSIYVLSLGGPRWIGPVTPFGGLSLMAGWLLLAWGALRS